MQGGAGGSWEVQGGAGRRREEQGGAGGSWEAERGAGGSWEELGGAGGSRWVQAAPGCPSPYVWHIGGEAEGHCYTFTHIYPQAPAAQQETPILPAVHVENKGGKADPF